MASEKDNSADQNPSNEDKNVDICETRKVIPQGSKLFFHPRTLRVGTKDSEANPSLQEWKRKKELFQRLKRKRQEFNSETEQSRKRDFQHLASRQAKAKGFRSQNKEIIEQSKSNAGIEDKVSEAVECGLRFHDLTKPKEMKKTKLEQELDEALESKDFDLAEKLNNEIVEREAASKLKAVVDVSNSLTKKKGERKRGKRKEKLKWNFEQKGRWESKGNM